MRAVLPHVTVGDTTLYVGFEQVSPLDAGDCARATHLWFVLFEDDISIWKLEEPWTDFSVEPHFDGAIPTCE
jgi:hypothetical protein